MYATLVLSRVLCSLSPPLTFSVNLRFYERGQRERERGGEREKEGERERGRERESGLQTEQKPSCVPETEWTSCQETVS